jgi:tRNA(His) 5'-end guanylyltransferase
MNNNSLESRMKSYENIFRNYLSPRQYFIVRCDLRAGGQYTKDLDKPFDDGFIEDMQGAALVLCEEIQGAQLAFVQSDEISVVFTDLIGENSDIWFGGNIQKIISLSAAVVTGEFQKLRIARINKWISENCRRWNDEELHYNIKQGFKVPQFDSRVFSISQRVEVMNYFYYRQKDCSRNSIQMLARHNFSHKECQGKNCSQLQDMLIGECNINWNLLDTHKKRGTVIYKGSNSQTTNPDDDLYESDWVIDKNPPILSQDWEYFNGKII